MSNDIPTYRDAFLRVSRRLVGCIVRSQTVKQIFVCKESVF